MVAFTHIGLRAFGSLVAGIIFAGAFSPLNMWILAPLSLTALIAIQWQTPIRVGAFTGMLFGFTSFFFQHFWLGVVGADAQWLLSIFLALWVAAIGAGTSFVSQRTSAPVAVLLITGLWVAQEALRGRLPFGGYPWARITLSQVDGPFAAWSTLAGVPFVTAVVVICAGAMALLLRIRSVPVLAGACAIVLLSVVAPRFVSMPSESSEVIQIAVIQGGTPQIGMGAMDVRRAVLDNHVRETIQLSEQIRNGDMPQPDLVLWPENSSDINPFTDADAYRSISSAAQAVDAPILVGAVVDSTENPETEVYNMGILWDPSTGPGDTYIKNAPVPFGEFIPFRSILTRFISRYERVTRDFAHGQEPGIFVVNGVTLGDLICFEVAVDRVVNRIINEGANVLLVQTNNATYSQTALPEQQLNIERMRAIEMGRTVVVAATTGISASINTKGEVVDVIADGEVGSFIYAAPVLTDRSPGSIIGPSVELIISVLSIAAIIGLAFRGRARAGQDSNPRQG